MLDEEVRTLNVDLRETVEGVWDENIPIIQHFVMAGVGVSCKLIGSEGIQLALQELAQELDLHILGSNVYEYGDNRISMTLLARGGNITVEACPKKGYIHLDLTVVLNGQDIDDDSYGEAFTAIFSPSSARILKVVY